MSNESSMDFVEAATAKTMHNFRWIFVINLEVIYSFLKRRVRRFITAYGPLNVGSIILLIDKIKK